MRISILLVLYKYRVVELATSKLSQGDVKRIEGGT